MFIEAVQAFILLFVIMDPLLSLAAFFSMTKGMRKEECRKIATQAVLVAAAPLFLFIFIGNGILSVLSVSMDSFQIAGGIILILLGVQLALGITWPKEKEEDEEDKKSAIAVVIGTPLITGPAVIATSILLVDKFGKETTAIAGMAALLCMWIILWFASFIHDKLGRSGLKVLSTMMGIITIAWGVEFIRQGLV